MILIVSFNARGIANLAKKLGLKFAVVDFWGDQDLFPLTEKIYTIFKPQFKSYEAFPNPRENEGKLVELALEVISKENIEGVLIGSGLDDRPELWRRISLVVPILGNTPACIKAARDVIAVHKKLDELGIQHPLTIQATKISEILDFIEEVGFPLVIKPHKTAGGEEICCIRNRSELIKFCHKNSKTLGEYYIQEYIKGEDISTTMVGDTKNFTVLSINRQLIGVRSSGTKLPFKYCGNLIPYECTQEIMERIIEDSIKIAEAFKLQGVFGIDFILHESIPYFMEINPRFPGTIEILEMVTKFNAVKGHLDAIQGYIPKENIKYKGYAIKQVLFTNKTITVPNLSQISHIYDIPPPNIVLHPEDPICTIQLFSENLEKLNQHVKSLVEKIYLTIQ